MALHSAITAAQKRRETKIGMASDNDLPLYAALGFGAGIYCFIRGFREFRKYRVLADTPLVPIRSIAMGLVEIHGKAQGDELLYSPVGHTPCFFYKVEIEKWVKDSKGRGRWSHHATDLNGVPFYIEDATGKVRVDLEGVEFDLNQNARREIGGGVGQGFVSMFTGGNKTDPALGLGPSDSELRDYIASVGSGFSVPKLVAAVATAASNHPGDPDAAPRAARRELELFRQRSALRRGAQQPSGGLRFVYDLVRSGALSRSAVASGRFRLTEFCVVPDRWYDLTGTCTENPQPRGEDDRNLIVKGENEPTFLISWRTEKEIEGHLRRRAWLYALGGGALAVICLAVLLNEFGLF
jgi:hypothetical protein